MADQIAPNIPDTWNLRGAIYAEEHDYEKAEDAFEKAGKLKPGDFWPKYNIAELMLMQKKYGPAAAAFEACRFTANQEWCIQDRVRGGAVGGYGWGEGGAGRDEIPEQYAGVLLCARGVGVREQGREARELLDEGGR